MLPAGTALLRIIIERNPRALDVSREEGTKFPGGRLLASDLRDPIDGVTFRTVGTACRLEEAGTLFLFCPLAVPANETAGIIRGARGLRAMK